MFVALILFKDSLITILKKMTSKKKELIKNLTQTISKESQRSSGSDKQLIEKLKKILEKLK